jgi:hypothetical protein
MVCFFAALAILNGRKTQSMKMLRMVLPSANITLLGLVIP